MKIAQYDEIIESVRQAYGSLTEPNFSFLKFDERTSPLQEIQNWFGKAKITEDTDPNTDVCFSFLIKSDKAERFLQLSLVGPYACVRILERVNRYLSHNDALKPLDIRIMEYLDNKNLALVEPPVLSMEIPGFVLPNADNKPVLVYHALFSDTGFDADRL